MRWGTLALLAITHATLAQDRLRIEVVPVYVSENVLVERESIVEYAGYYYDDDAMLAVHEALSIVTGRPRIYDVVWSENAESLFCTYARANSWTLCNDADLNYFSPDEMDNLHVTLGYETALDQSTPREPGEIVVLVLVKSPDFPWEHDIYGTATTSVWGSDGWNPEVMHWTTTACTVWSHLHVPTIAHELGHCFGLDHNEDDDNFDGTDDTLDLMAQYWSPTHPIRLKPSNKERVDQHFRKLEAPLETSFVPQSRTFH